MNIKTISPSDSLLEKRDYSSFYEIQIDGKTVLRASDCTDSPEDATLGRNLGFAYQITDLMKLAYEAGKRGEEFILESTTVDNDD